MSTFRRRAALLVAGSFILLAGCAPTPTSTPTTGRCDQRGPGVDLHACNLAGANLGGVDLTGGATFTDVSGSGITGVPSALPTNWVLIEGYLLGPTTDLEGQDLSGFDLSNLDLAGATLSNDIFVNADLSNANLTNANLANANLTNAIVSGTNFTGVFWFSTTCPNGNVQFGPC